jgi:hypothetical protein
MAQSLRSGRRCARVVALLLFAGAATLVACAEHVSQAPLPDPGPPTVVVTGAGSFPVAAQALGQNYWCWVAQWGDDVGRVQDKAASLGVDFLRAGGYNNDANTPEPFTHAQIDELVAYARAIGAAPSLQVPLIAGPDGRTPTPQLAADLVTYCNWTRGYGVKYWEIGNEPDLYAGKDKPDGYGVSDYCASFRSFAEAMKAVDPTIQVLGPELSWKYVPGNDWISPFLDQCGSQVDVVTIHLYPFPAAQCTIANAMSQGERFRATIRSVRALLDTHGTSGKPLGITESNLSWEGEPEKNTLPASLGTFYAGLWTADAIGIGLEERLWTLAFWSLSEGWTTGFYEHATARARPAAHAYRLYSSHFGPTLLHARTVPTGLSVYASRDDGARKTAVMLINRSASPRTEVVGFEDLPASLAKQAVRLPEYSLTLMEVPDGGGAPQVWRYTKALADRDQGPELQSQQ